MKEDELSDVYRLVFLMEEIAILESRFLPEDTGHLRTAVNVLKERVEEDIRKSDVMYGDSGKVDLGYYCFKFGLPSCKKYIIARVLEQKLKYEYGDALVHVEPV